MTDALTRNICESRLLVGFLGEKQQAAWWDCSFLSSSSPAFLIPVFPNSLLLAQYNGVCQAASRIHDELIGIGHHYHLFCLPESLERVCEKCLQDEEFSSSVAKNLSTKEKAINRIKELGITKINRAEGPIVVGDYSDAKLDELHKKLLSYYVDAFESNYKSFPYMRCI